MKSILLLSSVSKKSRLATEEISEEISANIKSLEENTRGVKSLVQERFLKISNSFALLSEIPGSVQLQDEKIHSCTVLQGE